ncbi:hypothetical protein AB9K35_09495 [Leisingera sp. XS_AS12]|uniref:hypothetical protein n=1 Tax=Leisingera sp. XS_AS12 TaxID=3241294 RepID=UPI0035176011
MAASSNSGRKKSYNEGQVSRALADLKIRGLEPSVENVARHMIEEQHLTAKPRPEGLRQMIQEVQDAKEEQRVLKLIAALPRSATDFIDQAIDKSRRQLVAGIAESFSELKEQSTLPLQEAQERLQSMRDELRRKREEQDEFKNRLSAEEERVAVLEAEVQRKDLELDDAVKQIIALRAQLEAKDAVLEMLRPPGHQ